MSRTGHDTEREHHHAEAEVDHSPILETGRTFGKELGWFNNTSDTAKVIDTQILNVTGYDVSFVQKHHRVRDLLEANMRFSGKSFEGKGTFKGFGSAEDVYRAIDGKAPMASEFVGADGKSVGKIDLRQMSQLVRIEEYNQYLGSYAFKKEELYRRFVNGESLKVQCGETEVDLREVCPLDDMKNFDFEDYLKDIKKYQIGFQWLGGLRDQALKNKHIENGSNTLFRKTGRLNPYGSDEVLWMPVCTLASSRDARSDVPKIGVAQRAEGHVHEVGHFSEHNGTTVAFDINLLKIHRTQMTLLQHDRTNARMAHAAIGLAPTEDMLVKSEQRICPDGSSNCREDEKVSANVVVFGNDRKGMIYDGMRATYDQGMQEVRGFGLSDREADDLIFTKVIAPFIINDTKDWLMCFAKTVGNRLGYTAQKAITSGGENWKDYTIDKKSAGFCLDIPCKDGDPVTGLKRFFTFQELIHYVNERVAVGDIDGVDKSIRIQEFEGVSVEQAAKEATEGDDELEESGMETEITTEKMRAFLEVFKGIFGANLPAVLEEYTRNGLQAQVNFNGSTKKLFDIFTDQLRSRDFDAIIKITDVSGEEGKKEFFKLLQKFNSRNRQDLYDLNRTGNVIDRPKAEFDKETLVKIKKTKATPADFLLAVERTKSILGDKPGFSDVLEVKENEKKKLKEMESHEWGSVVWTVAQILNFVRKDTATAVLVKDKIENAKWLVQQALIISDKFYLMPKLDN